MTRKFVDCSTFAGEIDAGWKQCPSAHDNRISTAPVISLVASFMKVSTQLFEEFRRHQYGNRKFEFFLLKYPASSFQQVGVAIL